MRNLYILDVATGAARKLETGSDFDTFPTWSPRGAWIAFTSRRDGDYEIYRIRPDGTDLERLTQSPGNDAHPSFSPDGEWIAFATARQGFKDEAVQLLLSTTFQPSEEIRSCMPTVRMFAFSRTTRPRKVRRAGSRVAGRDETWRRRFGHDSIGISAHVSPRAARAPTDARPRSAAARRRARASARARRPARHRSLRGWSSRRSCLRETSAE